MSNLKPYRQEIEATRRPSGSFAILDFGLINGPLSFWSKFRRATSLIVALAITFAGAASLIYLPFGSIATCWSGWALMIGMGWLYVDFIDATPNEERGQ